MTFQSQRTAFKAINLTLIYALSLNSIMPGIAAYGQLLHKPLSGKSGFSPLYAVSAQPLEAVPEASLPKIVPAKGPAALTAIDGDEAIVMAAPQALQASSQSESSGFSLNSAED